MCICAPTRLPSPQLWLPHVGSPAPGLTPPCCCHQEVKGNHQELEGEATRKCRGKLPGGEGELPGSEGRSCQEVRGEITRK